MRAELAGSLPDPQAIEASKQGAGPSFAGIEIGIEGPAVVAEPHDPAVTSRNRAALDPSWLAADAEVSWATSKLRAHRPEFLLDGQNLLRPE